MNRRLNKLRKHDENSKIAKDDNYMNTPEDKLSKWQININIGTEVLPKTDLFSKVAKIIAIVADYVKTKIINSRKPHMMTVEIKLSQR